MSSGPPQPPRAGFWRRVLASTIDGFVVVLPFQVIAVVLFALTSGFVQQSVGITGNTCTRVAQVPAGLVPPPPANSNFALRCTASILGHLTASTVLVGRTTTDGATTTVVSQTYMLDRDGKPVNGMSINWIPEIALIAYLIFLGTRGGTLGDAMMNIRLIDVDAPEAPRVPLRKVVVRYLALGIGFLLMLVPLLIATFSDDADAQGMRIAAWLPLGGIVALAWMIWIAVQVVRKHDPIYDQVAGTALIKN